MPLKPGRRLAWQSLQRGTLDAYWKDLESGAPEEPLVATDGDLFALVHDDPQTRPDIRVVLGWDREMARAVGRR